FFSSRRRHTRFSRDWSSDVCSSDLFLKKILKYAVILFLIISIASIVVNLERFFGGTFKIIRIGNMSLIMIGAAFYLYELLQSPRSEERRVGKECRCQCCARTESNKL